MLNFILISLIVAFIVTFVIITSEKLGITARIASKTQSRFFNKLLSCYFCMGFWLSLYIACFIVIFTNDILNIFICIPVAVLTRKLI